MILVDMNQCMISNLMIQMKTMSSNNEINIDLVRHMIIRSLFNYRKKFHEKYGDMILCYDSKNYWRKDIFPYYKQNRKKERGESEYNWNSIFECLNQIRNEIKENLGFIVLEVDRCEADDLISVISRTYDTNSNIILSGDKDFKQLLHFDHIDQYDPISKKFISGVLDKHQLQEHIIRGDRSDGIPNILSDDDTFVSGKRQKPITQAFLKNYLGTNLSNFDNYERNESLIDLTKIPSDIENEIRVKFVEATLNKSRMNINYIVQHKLSSIIS